MNDAPGSHIKTPVCLNLFKSPHPKVVAQSPRENVTAPMKKQKMSKNLNKQTDEPTQRENFVRVYGASYFAVKLSRQKGMCVREEVHKAEKFKQCQGFI